MKVLELEKVYLRRGNFLLKDISFSVEENSITALSGRSGAGKTTLIGLIGNDLRADAGKIRYFGKEMYESEADIRKRISVMYDTPNFNMEMKAARVAKEIKRFEPWFDMEEFQSYMKRFQLEGAKRVKHYSKGMQKKYMLALSLCRKPELLVMDEPTSGLDQLSREEMRNVLEEYRKAHKLTIVFSTHHSEDLELFATRSLVLENGGLA